jgi:hypothetical protein
MKPKKATTKKLIAAAFFAVFISACGCVRAQKMTMTVKTELKPKVRIHICGSTAINIDWGDGETERRQYEPDNVYNKDEAHGGYEYEHEYSIASARTVTVTGSNITGFYCYNSELTKLDVSKNTSLARLRCSFNRLKRLDVSKNRFLIELYCTRNSLTRLDVSKNISLAYLYCNGNRLKSLNLRKNTALTDLACGSNKLKNLDMSKNTSLAYLDCTNNQFSASELNALFETLHSNDVEADKIINISGNPGTDTCNIKIAEDKGWTVALFL